MGKSAIVVEGGGMRVSFAAGVLDAFDNRDFDPFDLYAGVSAGACNLTSYVAKQPLRNHRNFTGAMLTSKFMSFPRYLLGGNFTDLDWMWNHWEEEDPIDIVKAEEHLKDREIFITCTSFETGEAKYFDLVGSDWYQILKASSALPMAYRQPVIVDGHKYVDGGIADPIPIREVYRRGAKEILVIRSRPSTYRKRAGFEAKMMRYVYRNNPGLLATIERREEIYNDSVEFINNPPDDARIAYIAPTPYQQSSRVSQSLAPIVYDYRMGYAMGQVYLEQFSGDLKVA